MLEWKIKVALLWLLQPINYVSYILIGLVETEPFGAMVEPGAGLVIAVFFFIPCLMAWVSVVSPAMSRWANIALAAVFAILKLAAALGLVVELSPAIFFNELWAFFAAALIVWYAWKLPRAPGTEAEPTTAS
jgi:hypothetical protein